MYRCRWWSSSATPKHVALEEDWNLKQSNSGESDWYWAEEARPIRDIKILCCTYPLCQFSTSRLRSRVKTIIHIIGKYSYQCITTGISVNMIASKGRWKQTQAIHQVCFFPGNYIFLNKQYKSILRCDVAISLCHNSTDPLSPDCLNMNQPGTDEDGIALTLYWLVVDTSKERWMTDRPWY